MVEANTGTIDYGIDLGTTTSSVAVVDGNTTTVIPNKTDNKNFVNSAVYIKKNGTIFIGDKAKNKIATDPKNGYAEFKLRMGSDHLYTFESTGKQMTPVELSAEILKNLKQTVKEKNNKDINAAVITVPADFNAPQNKDTTEAAKLAGFDQVILLQEPTAAAMAYGFDSTGDNEIWLIYDLGGGTFDVSIMQKTNEEIVNVNNHGDSNLGGKLIDWAIVDKILVPAVIDELGLTDFERNNTKYLKQFAKLKSAAETAKTDLSNYDTAEIELENFIITDDGDFFDFEYDMTRSELEEVMKPYVDRTINHCNKALKDANLSISDVTKIILVGGSTLSPYIHERLKEEFNIPLEYSIDPTTVVARGAAIFAGTKAIDPNIRDDDISDPGSNDVSIEVMYDTMGDDIEFDVSGKIINPNGSPEGYSVEFTNNKTNYSSGQIPVNNNGVFMTELLAEDEENYNIYEIKVYDANSNLVTLSSSSVNTIKYIMKAPPSQSKLSHTMGLGKFGNVLDIIAEKGTPLPFEFEKIYRTPNYVHKGNPSEKVYMPWYEGNNMYADRNTLIAELTITGEHIKRDLPENSEVELSVYIDESMNISSSVYIPFLDQEFDEVQHHDEGGVRKIRGNYSLVELKNKFEEQHQRYNELLSKSVSINDMEVTNYFNQIKGEHMIEDIQTFLETSETDPDALDNANKRINDFTNILDHIQVILDSQCSWDEVKSEVDEYMGIVRQEIFKAEPQIQNLFNQLQDVYNQAVANKNLDLLRRVKDQLMAIIAEMHRKELVQMAFLELSTSGVFIDRAAADRLIAQGNDALNSGNFEELERVVGQLYRIEKSNKPGEPEDNRPKDARLK